MEAQKPVKVLQIGEGNFLRAFADYIIEIANREGVMSTDVVIAQAIPSGNADRINAASGKYTLLMRGLENGRLVENAEKINCVKKCINIYTEYAEFLDFARSEDLEIVISNTTEAGIVFSENDSFSDAPPSTFPAKMTVFLHKRFEFFRGDRNKGIFFMPVELIEENGTRLRECILRYASLWSLGEDFIEWLDASCCFANTLVDRIVTGFPRDDCEEIFSQLGYRDKLLVTSEPFLFWAIECPRKWAEKLSLDKLGLDIIFSENITPYKTRKVRILNGAHTLSVLAAFLEGHNTVLEMMNDNSYKNHIKNAMFSEIIPLIDLPHEELLQFANAVLERFSNPFIKHRLLDISLNSVSKFKARCLCSLLDYREKFGTLPFALTYALAALIVFYRGEWLDGRYLGSRGGESYEIKDDRENLEAFYKAWQGENTVEEILCNEKLWGMKLCGIPGLEQKVKSFIGADGTLKKLANIAETEK